MKLYHITPADDTTVKTVRLEGLRADENNEILLFENVSFQMNGVQNTIADYIARKQMNIDEYVMFEIDSLGIMALEKYETEGIFLDSVWIAKQPIMLPIIEPKFINFFGRHTTAYRDLHIWE